MLENMILEFLSARGNCSNPLHNKPNRNSKTTLPCHSQKKIWAMSINSSDKECYKPGLVGKKILMIQKTKQLQLQKPNFYKFYME